MKIKIPTAIDIVEDDSLMRKRDELKKSNMKRYADNKISCFQHLFSTCAARTVFSIVRINRSDSAFVFGHKGVILSKIIGELDVPKIDKIFASFGIPKVEIG
jgi:hypothetical protein